MSDSTNKESSASRSKIKKLALYIKENPEDSFSKFALALEFLKMNEINKARILFESIRDNDPGYAGVYYHLGQLYERIGENINAIKTYKKGIRIASDKNETHTVTELKEVLVELEMELE